MLDRFTKDQALRALENLQYGSFELTTPEGQTYRFEGDKPGVSAQFEIADWRVVRNLAAKGDIGMAEDYRDGLWQSDNLLDLFSVSLMNEQMLERFIYGSPISRMLQRLSYLGKMNSLAGSRRNIHAHYDLGNDFYKLWLDPSMTYSSALFRSPDDSLEQAQHNKNHRILQQLQAQSGSVLEVGCGWGGFAEDALAQGDFAFKGITLSQQQHAYAQQRLDGAARIALEDYRLQQGAYDYIVSIEMFEAVGERYWETYFNKIKQLLAKNGKALIQTITIDERYFESYRKSGDMIRTFIFPGGMLPSAERFGAEAHKAGLQIHDRFAFGADYATTLKQWLTNFDACRDEVRGQGFDDGFIRLWRFYLASCAALFAVGRTDVMQVELRHA